MSEKMRTVMYSDLPFKNLFKNSYFGFMSTPLGLILLVIGSAFIDTGQDAAPDSSLINHMP